MKTEFYKIFDPAVACSEIAHAGEVIRAGGLVVFPTETVYGIGGDATNAEAARAIYAAKGRPSDNPLIIHIASPEDAEKYAVTNETYYRLAERFCPGPLTVILPRRETIPLSVTGGLDTVAVRCPSNKVANALIKAAGVPIAAPSANLSGKPSPTLAEHVVHDMDGRVNIIIDGGPCDFGLESTIIKLDGDIGTLLRPGAVTYDELCEVCAQVNIAPAVVGKLAENEHPLSPGMKYRHYAPKVPMTLLCGNKESVLAFLREEASKKDGIGFLCYDGEIADCPANITLFPVGAEEDLQAQAHLLFAALRKADETPSVTKLYAHLPPRTGIGLALYNRSIRAAAHDILKV